MYRNEIPERNLLDAFSETVNAIPGAYLSMEQVGNRRDESIGGLARFWTEPINRPTQLLLEVKRDLLPHSLPQIATLARQYVQTIKKWRSNINDDDWAVVLLADAIPNDIRIWMQNNRIGYYDRSGSVFLPTKSTYILVDRLSAAKSEKAVDYVFEGRRPLIIEALWEVQDTWMGVSRIVKRVEGSTSLVSQTLAELRRWGWIDTKEGGPAKVRLSNWNNLLDRWASHEAAKGEWPLERYYVPNTSPELLGAGIACICDDRKIHYEITGEWASNRYTSRSSPISHVQIRVIDAGAINFIVEALGAKRQTENWNLGLIAAAPGQEIRFVDRTTNIAVASPLRTYLDLLRSGSQAKQQASELRHRRLQA